MPKSKVALAYIGPLLHTLISLPFEIVGLAVVAYIYRYRDVDLAHMKTLHKWAMPWVNPEDWTGGWRGFKPGDNCVPADMREEFSGFWGFYRYHALRNRAHGLRNYSWYNAKMKEGEIEYVTPDYCKAYSDWWLFKNRDLKPGSRFWFVSWQGFYCSYKYIRYFSFRGKLYYIHWQAGWRIKPVDAEEGYKESSMRWKYGAPPTIQPPHFGRAGSDYD